MTERKSITVDWSQPMTDAQDNPVKGLTLRDIVRPALLVELPSEADRPDPLERSLRYDLWNKLRDSDEMTTAEIELLKRRVGLVCTTLSMGRVLDALPK